MTMWINNLVLSTDEGLTLETSAFECLYGGQFTLSTQLIKPNYLVKLPPTQHHSFFRNLPPLSLCGSIVANPIIYRLVPSPSRYEIRQWTFLVLKTWQQTSLDSYEALYDSICDSHGVASRANRLPAWRIDNRGNDSCRFDRIDTNRFDRIDSNRQHFQPTLHGPPEVKTFLVQVFHTNQIGSTIDNQSNLLFLLQVHVTWYFC